MKSTIPFFLVLAAVSPAFAGQEALLGRWQSKDKRETMEFTAEGRVSSFSGPVGVSGQYECHGDDQVSLKFEGDGAPPRMDFSYTVDGENLKLKNTDGKVVMEFVKWKKKALPPASGWKDRSNTHSFAMPHVRPRYSS